MAGAGQAVQQSLGTINPSSLIGQADTSIVSPKATAALIDAFRSGVVSADDIVSRIGQLGQSKKKAEIDMAGVQSMQAQEAMSPEVVAARAAQVQAATVAAQSQIEKTQFPATSVFDKLAPGAGVEAPVLPDGVTPDSRKKEKLGSRLAAWDALRSEARTELKNMRPHIDPITNELGRITEQGEVVSNAKVEALQKQSRQTFQEFDSLFPGTSSGVTTVAPVVEPLTPRSAVSPNVVVGAPTPSGMGYSLGAPKLAAGAKPADPVERAQQIAAAQSQISQIDAARAAVTRGDATGPLEGSGAAKIFNNVAAAFGARESAYEDQRDLQIVLSQKVLEGAQLMKGNLSDKDIRFLEASVPKLKDTNNTWNSFLDRWERMTKLNVDILSGRTPPSVTDLFAPKDWETDSKTAVAPSSAPARFNSPTEVPATTQFVVGPNGKQYVNPNYRP